ncbi:unnamed protein product [Amoebophrya sp. A120]|nr:unnamed protein product [Amoebophrya sp. A120]|eukprot:GSA120T00014130001.1
MNPDDDGWKYGNPPGQLTWAGWGRPKEERTAFFLSQKNSHQTAPFVPIVLHAVVCKNNLNRNKALRLLRPHCRPRQRSHPHGRAATMPTTPSQRWKPPCRTPTLRKHITLFYVTTCRIKNKGMLFEL